MSKKLKEHTDDELQAELARRGLTSTKEGSPMGKEARDPSSPIPAADPTRPGKDMHQPLEGDEVSGLESPEEQGRRASQNPTPQPASQERDGEVGGAVRDDTDEDTDEGDQTVEEGDETSEDSKDEESAPI